MNRQMLSFVNCWSIERKRGADQWVIPVEITYTNGRPVGITPLLYPTKKIASENCSVGDRPVKVRVTVDVVK